MASLRIPISVQNFPPAFALCRPPGAFCLAGSAPPQPPAWQRSRAAGSCPPRPPAESPRTVEPSHLPAPPLQGGGSWNPAPETASDPVQLSSQAACPASPQPQNALHRPFWGHFPWASSAAWGGAGSLSTRLCSDGSFQKRSKITRAPSIEMYVIKMETHLGSYSMELTRITLT